MRKYICDRCKKEIELGSLREEPMVEVDGKHFYRNFDLCSACCDRLCSLIDGFLVMKEEKR